MARKPWPWIEAMEEVLKYDESINFTSYAIGNKNIQDESLLKEKSQQKTSSIINNTNNNNNNDINTIEIKSKFEPDQSSNNKIITPRNSENEFKRYLHIFKNLGHCLRMPSVFQMKIYKFKVIIYYFSVVMKIL